MSTLSPYDQLVANGAIASLKRDVLLGAADDIYYVSHIQKWFEEDAGAGAEAVSFDCSVRVAKELLEGGYCFLAVWAKGGGISRLPLPVGDLPRFIESRYKATDGPFELFLVATEAGKSWVERYQTLVSEI